MASYTKTIKELEARIEKQTSLRDAALLKGKANYAADASNKIEQIRAEIEALKLDRYERFGIAS